MSNINIGTKMRSLQVGRKQSAVTGVIVHVGQNDSGNSVSYSSGDSTGYVLEVTNPIGTQQMADTILSSLKLRGFQYQPFDAQSSDIDPAAEIGDGVTVNGTDSVIMSAKTNHSHIMAADLSAPFDEEVDHEFTYAPRQTREFIRESAYTRSRITQTESQIALEVARATDAENALSSRIEINATDISAKVSKTGGSPSSFGWTLTDSSWTLSSNGSTVLKATSEGIEVSGKITATSGTIGGVTIANGVLSGITDTNIAIGGISGGTYGSIGGGTVTTYNFPSGVNTNLGHAAGYGAATTNGTSVYPDYFSAGQIKVYGYINAIGINTTGNSNQASLFNSPLWIGTDGGALRFLGYDVSWKQVRYVSDIVGGVPEYTTVYLMGR